MAHFLFALSPITFLPLALSTVNCQLLIVNCQLSPVNCQLSTVNRPSLLCARGVVRAQKLLNNIVIVVDIPSL